MLIGEVARKARLTRDTIRFYENAGLLSSGKKQAGSRVYNDYAPEVVERLAFIKQAQNIGFTLREIKHILDEWGGDVNAVPPAELIHLVETKLGQIEEKLRHLEEMREFLSNKLKRLQAEGTSQ